MKVVMVGVDGSADSDGALRWAAADAARTGRELRIVHAYDWRGYASLSPVPPSFVEGVEAIARTVASTSADQVREWFPGLTVRAEAVLGHAGHVLAESSKDAELVVVGSRGRGGFGGLLLGSVGQHVATHATSSVAVIRGREDAAGPVLVGVGDLETGDAALAAAFAWASAHGTGVSVVHASPPVHVLYGLDVVTPAEEDQRRAEEQARLVTAIQPWRERFPAVDVAATVATGHPAEILIDRSRAARLVVVGTRGHGSLTGLLLGSVGLQLLHHAACPVVVARPARA